MNDLKIQDFYTLSPMQQGMLFHSQFAPGSGVDIEQIVFDLNEKVEVSFFKQAWTKVVERHSILRTSFKWDGLDNPVQQVNNIFELQFSVDDISSLSVSDQQNILEEFYASDRKKGFDLNTPLLMRVKVYTLSESHYVCIWTFHHILLDGRSFPIIINEVFDIYKKLQSGQSINLPLPKPYIEYIKWLEKLDESKSNVFWKKYLEGFKSPTQLNFNKFDYEKDEVRTGYDVSYHYVTETLTDAIVGFAKDNHLTPYTIILAAWSLLLSKYSSDKDVVFGATRSCRKNTVEGSDDMVGLFINTLPVRVKTGKNKNVVEWLKEIREEQIQLRDYEHTHLIKIQNASEFHGDKHLFESILVFENYLLDSHLRSQGGEWINRKFKVLEQTNYPITLFGYLDKELFFKLEYDKSRFSKKSAEWINKHLESILDELVKSQNKIISELSFITDEEKKIILSEWNNTKSFYESDVCIHQLFERTAKKFPDKIAVIVKDESITFSELNKKANRLAHKLISLGVKSGINVGICTNRTIEMIVAIIGIHKAGASYLPLDPQYPSERLQFKADDAEIRVLITQPELLKIIPKVNAEILQLDPGFEILEDEPEHNPDLNISSENLAYLIYTSGSTGKPKGVMVTHKNVVNFFAGMDKHIKYDEQSVWLAVTSLSFDISVLELLWTLTRGLKIVLYTGDDMKTDISTSASSIDFSLFYFSSYEGEKNTNKYKLLLEGSKYADENNFKAVWTPERHFYDFGGLYPNPSITSAAISTITKNIGIRAGSVVSPLHSTIRIAEEWSMVDNLSLGRVGISFAAGWQPNDFVIMPENFKDRKDLMFRQIDEVQKLWSGEKVAFKNPNGKEIQINILPKPVQKKLPVWVTAAGNPETFEMAGKFGHNLLTHLLGQSISELAEKINIYRKAWNDAGHKGIGTLTLMLHTFVGTDEKMVKETVRGPMKNYLKSAVNLVKEAAWSFPVFKNATTGADGNFNMDNLSNEDMDAILDYSFDRYYSTSGLFGTPESCKKIVSKLKEIDVDEIACLIDFGVDSDLVLAHLYYLNQLRRQSNVQFQTPDDLEKYSVGELIKTHSVTHMQCTPSMAKMLVLDEQSASALSNLKIMLVGGEAFPLNLAHSLQTKVNGEILNMYGPTETTIWSTLYKLDTSLGNTIPIGKPIINTTIYILDEDYNLNPIGVPGELCIGGDGVTNGYYNRQQLTSEKFIADKFSATEGAKFYRTGDLAYQKEDGTLEFLGRLDHQVKLRGHRIELGEIETVLSSHSDVRECVVIAREDVPGDQRLVAYLIPENGVQLNFDLLRELTIEKLPDFMVPSNFVTMNNFPLTPNGKIDRKAFPVPFNNEIETEKTDFVIPESELEMKIADIWQELLKIPRVGVNDNFFDIGGHSLLAVQLHAKLKQYIDDELTLIDVFRFPTINAIQKYLAGKNNLTEGNENIHSSKRILLSKQRLSRLKTTGKNDSIES